MLRPDGTAVGRRLCLDGFAINVVKTPQRHYNLHKFPGLARQTALQSVNDEG